MKAMNIKGLYPKRNLSAPKLGAQKFPYLLRNLKATKANQIWSTDITYLKTPAGYMYLTAIIDVYSRKILAWRLSNTMTKEFCLECYKEAVEIYGAPEILNTDQGSQYTSNEFIKLVVGTTEEPKPTKLSMDGKGRCLDNVWIERFWRTIKYDYLFLYEHKNNFELYHGIKYFINYYNENRCHSSLEYMTPSEVYKIPNLVFKKIA